MNDKCADRQQKGNDKDFQINAYGLGKVGKIYSQNKRYGLHNKESRSFFCRQAAFKNKL